MNHAVYLCVMVFEVSFFDVAGTNKVFGFCCIETGFLIWVSTQLIRLLN